jgi:hypothetical protein
MTGPTQGSRAIDPLVADSRDLQLIRAIAHVGNDYHQATGGHAAKVSISFQKHGLRTVSSSGHGSTDSTWATTNHHDVGLRAYFQFSCGFENGLCTGRTIAQRIVSFNRTLPGPIADGQVPISLQAGEDSS